MYEMEGAPRASRHPAGSDRSGAMALRNPATASVILRTPVARCSLALKFPSEPITVAGDVRDF
jgi:hypothetical protein